MTRGIGSHWLDDGMILYCTEVAYNVITFSLLYPFCMNLAKATK